MKTRTTRLNFISYFLLLLFFLFLQTDAVFAQLKDTSHIESKLLSNRRNHIYYSKHSEKLDTIFISSNRNNSIDKIRQAKNILRLVKGDALLNAQAKKNTFTVTATITITVTSTGTTCGNSNGSFTITATGGTPP